MAEYVPEEWLSDFDGREYGVGVVRGTRSFGVDESDGTLTGVYYCTPWEPGENNALCFAYGALDNYPYNSTKATSYMMGGRLIPLSEMTFPENHSMNDCSCGYYAYYNGSNDYYSAYTAPVSGVVEGYGETVIGTKGFRTRKARIVALCIPGRVSDVKPRTWWKYSTWKRSTQWGVAITSAILMIAALVTGIVIAAIHAHLSPLSFLPFFTGPLAFLATTSFLRATGGRRRYPAELSDKDITKVRAKYPNIPIYNSFEDMIAAFPPDRGALKQMEQKK